MWPSPRPLQLRVLDNLRANTYGAHKLPEARFWVFHITIHLLHELLPKHLQGAGMKNVVIALQLAVYYNARPEMYASY